MNLIFLTEHVTVLRDLEVYVDSALKFNEHVSFIIGGSLCTLCILSCLVRNYSSYATFVKLYSCLVRPKLEFASVVWNNIGSCNSANIEAVQRHDVRILYDLYFGRRVYFDYGRLLERLHITPLHVRTMHNVLFLYKVVTGVINVPSLLSLINFNVPRRVTRRTLPFC